jgi:hypothetical protein
LQVYERRHLCVLAMLGYGIIGKDSEGGHVRKRVVVSFCCRLTGTRTHLLSTLLIPIVTILLHFLQIVQVQLGLGVVTIVLLLLLLLPLLLLLR